MKPILQQVLFSSALLKQFPTMFVCTIFPHKLSFLADELFRSRWVASLASWACIMGFSEVQLTKETLEEEDKGRSAARSDEVVRTWGGRSPPEQDNSGGLSSRGGTGRQRERTVLDEESLEVLCSRREAQRRRGCKRRVQPVIIVQELGAKTCRSSLGETKEEEVTAKKTKPK